MTNTEIREMLKHIEVRIADLKQTIVNPTKPKVIDCESYGGFRDSTVDMDEYIESTKQMLDLNIRWYGVLDVELLTRRAAK